MGCHGRIIGTVCAVDVQLNARIHKDRVAVTGLVADRHAATESSHQVQMSKTDVAMVPSSAPSELPYYVEARDVPGSEERDLTGSIGDNDTMPDPRITSPMPSISS